jgi:hypothetical protein
MVRAKFKLPSVRLPAMLRRKKKVDPETMELASLANLKQLFDGMGEPTPAYVAELRPAARAIRQALSGQKLDDAGAAFKKLAAAVDKEYDAFDGALVEYIACGMVEDPEEKQKREDKAAAAEEAAATALKSGASRDTVAVVLQSDPEAAAYLAAGVARPRALAAFKLLALKKYCEGMEAALQEGYVVVRPSKLAAPLFPLIDATLLGTGSERLVEHMRLCGETFTQQQLQSSLYLALEPDVAAAAEVMLEQPSMDKKKRKELDKYAKTYLLDVVELNVKSRCVFNWSSPKFLLNGGVKPVEDDDTLVVGDLTAGRHEFFPEAASTVAMFHKDYTGKRREVYEKKRQNNKTMWNGIYFFMGTMVFDFVVMSK